MLTPNQSVSQKRFHQWVNHKKKLSLRHPLPTFGSFSFSRQTLWLGIDKVLQKLTKSHKSEISHLFCFCILIPRKCLRKNPFQHIVPPCLLDFSWSVNIISTRGRSRLCPLYYSTLQIFRPSYGPDLYSSKWARWRYRLGKIQICIVINCRKSFQETRWLVL